MWVMVVAVIVMMKAYAFSGATGDGVGGCVVVLVRTGVGVPVGGWVGRCVGGEVVVELGSGVGVLVGAGNE